MYKYRLWLYYYNLKESEVLRDELVDKYEFKDPTTVVEQCKEIYRLAKEAKQLIRAIKSKMNFDFSRVPEGTDAIQVRLERVNCYRECCYDAGIGEVKGITWTEKVEEDLVEEVIRLDDLQE